MKKNLVVTLLILLASMSVYAQKKEGLKLDIAAFNKNVEIAEWLYEYDIIAWWTTDSAMAQDKKEIQRLGAEWFCFKDKNNIWHATYGKYANEKFDMVFHFTVDTASKVQRNFEVIDTGLTHTYCRALQTANKQLTKLRDSVSIRFNQYIKKNADNTFTVYIFPAFQPNEVAIHGAQFIFDIDATGRTILKDNSYFQGQFKGFKVNKPREIWLDYTELSQPNLETVFFVWYYKKYFTFIKIETKDHITTVMKNENSDYFWTHIEKEEEKKEKKEKRN